MCWYKFLNCVAVKPYHQTKVCLIRDIPLFTKSVSSDEQSKAATLKYTFVETAFVVFPIHWIPSNLVTVSSILSF